MLGPSPIAPAPTIPLLVRALPWALLLVSAILMFLGFAGFGIWPLAFVGMLPALFVFDPREVRGGFARPSGAAFFWRALFFGYVAELGGFYWIVHTLVEFSGFPFAICLLFGSIFFLFQALQFVLILALWSRARARGFAASPALIAAYLASEAVFPMLFEHSYGAAFHPVPVLMQVADLGGPMMCTAIAMSVNGALYELASGLCAKPRRLPRLWPAIALAYLVFAIGYGAYRISEADARSAAAPHLEIGVVQANLGLGLERGGPERGALAHVEQTERLIARHDPDLVVWPESAMLFMIPDGLDDLDRWVWTRRLGLDRLEVPIVFGAMREHELADGRRVDRNTAFVIDGERRVLGRYDKTYLLAFGEFLPLGETFPVLYDISPMSGRFTPGEDFSPIELPARDGNTYRLTALICYEDIVSAFVRAAVREGDPHVMLNLTNDSWFGDTQEPWVHMNLARFRAIEHRRWLVRATNSGVSAVIDDAGRVVEAGGTFRREEFAAPVAMISGVTTLYSVLGAWPGWVALVTILAMGFLPERFLPKRRLPPGS